MTTEKRTPGEWKRWVRNDGVIIYGGELKPGPNGSFIHTHIARIIGDDEEAKANAEFIVHACNLHEELVAGLVAISRQDVGDDECAYFNAAYQCKDIAHALLSKSQEPPSG